MTTPATIANQALDAIGLGGDVVISDLEDGTREAQICLRHYGQCLRQLLRMQNWDFARKTAPLTLLGDATGQTADVGTMVPIPWVYVYSYPIDCMKLRFIPWNGLMTPAIPAGNIQSPEALPSQNIPGVYSPVFAGQRLIPAPFVIAEDYNYPVSIPVGYQDIPGVSQQGRTVVLTNVQNAQAVYTALISSPSQWDPLFRALFVSFLSSEIAIPMWRQDPKVGLAMKQQAIQDYKQKKIDARIADGNEGTSSTSHVPDFIRVRNSGNGMSRGYFSSNGVIYGSDCGLGWGPGWGGMDDGGIY